MKTGILFAIVSILIGCNGASGSAGAAGPSGPAGSPGQDGQQGPSGESGNNGTDGSMGLPGPEGPPGPFGMSKQDMYEIVDTKSVNSGAQMMLVASCATTSDIVLNGGCAFDNLFGMVKGSKAVNASDGATEAGWACEVYNASGSASNYSVTAICMVTP